MHDNTIVRIFGIPFTRRCCSIVWPRRATRSHRRNGLLVYFRFAAAAGNVEIGASLTRTAWSGRRSWLPFTDQNPSGRAGRCPCCDGQRRRNQSCQHQSDYNSHGWRSIVRSHDRMLLFNRSAPACGAFALSEHSSCVFPPCRLPCRGQAQTQTHSGNCSPRGFCICQHAAHLYNTADGSPDHKLERMLGWVAGLTRTL